MQSAFERVSAVAESSGGIVADANIRQEGENRRASITIRVPSSRYQDALNQLRGLAVTVDSERINANDVTEEFTDLQSRQRNLEATEQQLLTFLGQARNVTEVMQVQERLTATRGEIEKVRGRINLLGRLTELATIQVQLRPEVGPAANAPGLAASPTAAFERGWDASVAVLRGALIAVLTIAGFAWWLLPLVALSVWLLRRRTTPAAPAAPAAE